MKNFRYILTILCLCFLSKLQAQNNQWTVEQTNKAQQDVELVSDVIKLSENQKELIKEIFLEKENFFKKDSRLSEKRRNWVIDRYLVRIEDIIRYGYEVNRTLNQNNPKVNKELVTKEQFTQKILNNDTLIHSLGLNKVNE